MRRVIGLTGLVLALALLRWLQRQQEAEDRLFTDDELSAPLDTSRLVDLDDFEADMWKDDDDGGTSPLR